MVDDGWSVSPEQVSVVLQNVDVAGEPLGQAVKDAQALAERRSDLIVTGRTTLAEAWDDFLDVRALVPGKAITAVSNAAAAVVEGVLAITAGDDAMAASWRSENPGLFERQVQQG
ncbi:hypothetical protein ACIQTT_07470 [Microbacterium sp. NPDC090225]|uniref:hypothetical protein n=1 Tax=Microbacterium sp. NPDC090225 TaxID=3364207 RepID=UPI0038199618